MTQLSLMKDEKKEEKRILFDKYELGRLLGKGTFASVFYGKSLINGDIVAVKVIDKADMERAGMLDQIKREIYVMGKVKHPNVVEIKEVMATKTKIYIVMEFLAGGELSDKLMRIKSLPEDDARRYFQQIISAIDFCHSRHVYHRDLKLENLLLDKSHENVKVADFGLSATKDQIRGNGLLYTVCGALSYMAPEVLQEMGYNGVKADIWSCGVILYCLLSGMLPFQDESMGTMCTKIASGDYDFPPRFPSGARRLVSKMLAVDPDRRISMEAIRRDPWLYRGVNRSISTANLANMAKSSRNTISPELISNLKRKSENQNGGVQSETSTSSTPVFFNAFELISSMASGFDLSTLFQEERKAATIFTSRRSEAEIVAAIERMGKRGVGGELGAIRRYEVEKIKAGSKVRLVAAADGGVGRKGPLTVTAEVFRAAPEMAVVEFKKDSGDTMEFERFCAEEARPGLRDIVWAWKGDGTADGSDLCCDSKCSSLCDEEDEVDGEI